MLSWYGYVKKFVPKKLWKYYFMRRNVSRPMIWTVPEDLIGFDYK
jgi:hypothetical protein